MTGPHSLLQAPQSGATVRMYRQGLGDCFLLALPTLERQQSYYVLIDCGVLQRTPDAVATMNTVAHDILASTGGRIDLLVVTHEHWDHVSGFVQARQVFERMRVNNVWLAWTEDPQDLLGQELRAASTRDQTALYEGLNRALREAPEAKTPSFANLLAFFGTPPQDALESPLALAGGHTQRALQVVRDLVDATHGSTEYLRPGQGPLVLPDSIGPAGRTPVQAYVLGPPHDRAALGRVAGTYSSIDDNSAALAGLLAPELQFDGPTRALESDVVFPFEPALRNPPETAAAHPFFRQLYPANDAAMAWRRIDDTWLGVAEELALRLDNRTNNTSLVLAFELPETRKILLFVGDAQSGNWLSWSDYSWSVTGSADRITVGDLLARTVLYKVGHHGSQNATMWREGLELMTNPELVAMLPTSFATAERQKPPWKMPFLPLLRRLEERTQYRVLRSDVDAPTLAVPAARAQWENFLTRGRVTDLYVEYTIT